MGRSSSFHCNVLLKQRVGKAGVKEDGEAAVLETCTLGRIKSFAERKQMCVAPAAVAKEAVVFACGLGCSAKGMDVKAGSNVRA